MQQVETIYDYKNSCTQAQNLLEGCLTSSKLRNGGQVYIKSGTPSQTTAMATTMKSEAPPLTPSFTITATPKMTSLPTQVTPTNVSSDFLSSIIQAVGIQANEDHIEPVVHQQQTSMPQYTLTIDGQTLKASPIQYKLTETTPSATFNIQPSTSTSSETGDLSGSISVDEFLKLKSTPKTTRKMQPLNIDLSGMTNVTKKAKIELDKKPKINFVLSTPTKQQQTIPMTVTSNQPKTISLQQLLQGSANKNQNMVPLIIKSDGTIEANNQILSQLIANNEMTPPKQLPQPQYTPPQPTTYVQLKIQQNPDGQPTVQLMPQQMPQTVQLSTQAFQNLNIQQQIQQQIQAQLAAQAQQMQNQVPNQVQITPLQLQTAFNQAQVQPTVSLAPSQQAHIIPQQIQPQQQQVSVDTQVSQSDITMEGATFQEQKPVTQQPKRQATKKVKQETTTQITTTRPVVTQQVSSQKPAVTSQSQSVSQQMKQDGGNNSDSDGPPTIESIMAQQQMQSITAIKHEGNDPPPTLTTCDVCKKIFKRKEHLMQHLKSHVGLRPFKCEEPNCNKSFSRKEHLLRHVVSHTGKKMFSCDLCHKFFSRKDNLNKHRR